MRASRLFSVLISFLVFGSASISFSQAPLPTTSAFETTPPITVRPSPTPSPTPKAGFFKNVARDQRAIWLSPFHIKKTDLKWLAPLALTTAGLIATDRKTSAWVGHNGSLPKISRGVSLLGSIYTTGGVAAGFYLFGRAAHNRRAEETGVLAAEALIGTAIVTEVLKYATGRIRPNSGSGRGLFFKNGKSFPSGHSSSAWAVATVVAYKYKDRPLIKYGAFAIAAAISLSRYSGRNHFLSDVVMGSAIGFGIGRFVVTHH